MSREESIIRTKLERAKILDESITTTPSTLRDKYISIRKTDEKWYNINPQYIQWKLDLENIPKTRKRPKKSHLITTEIKGV